MYLRQDRLQDHQEALVQQQDPAQAITGLVRLLAVHQEDHPVVPPLRGHPAVRQAIPLVVHLLLAVHRVIRQAVRQHRGHPVVRQVHPAAILLAALTVVHQVVAVHQEDRPVVLLRDRQAVHQVILLVVRQVVRQVAPQEDRPQVHLPVTQVPLTRVLTPVVADQAQAAVQVQDVHQHQAVHPPEDHQAVADKKHPPKVVSYFWGAIQSKEAFFHCT